MISMKSYIHLYDSLCLVLWHTNHCRLFKAKSVFVHMLYAHLQHHNDTIIKTDAMIRTQEDFFNKYMPLTLFVRVRKGCVGFYCERELEIEHICNILTLNWWLSCCVFLVLLMLTRSPGVHSAGWWLSLLHLISIFSGPQFIRAPSPFGLVWLFLPHLPPLELELNSTGPSSSTELYNCSTPTRSFKSNV